MFRLEAVFAFEGDCLLLHYGPDDDPKWILIDGGARGTWPRFLAPRLTQMSKEIGGPVPLQMVMVSHVDSDHISGVLDMFKHLRSDDEPEKLCDIKVLWHNSFDDTIGNDDQELISKLIAPAPDQPLDMDDPDVCDVVAVVQSVNQGRNLRLDAEALAVDTNKPFKGLVRMLDDAPTSIPQGEGLTFKVLLPSQERLEAYQKEWRDFLEEKGLAEVEAASFSDKSAFNLASIVVLAEKGGHSMLLTGDARGDDIVNALVAGGLLDEAAAFPVREKGERRAAWKARFDEAEELTDVPNIHVDLLKIPHHGSDRNVTTGFFRRVTADHYVISADGKHANPDRPTLEMIAEARGGDKYTIHFTFTADEHQTSTKADYRAALRKVHDWVENDKPTNCTVVHREDAEDVYSISIDLE